MMMMNCIVLYCIVLHCIVLHCILGASAFETACTYKRRRRRRKRNSTQIGRKRQTLERLWLRKMNENPHRPRSTPTAIKRTLLNTEIKVWTACQTNKDRIRKGRKRAHAGLTRQQVCCEYFSGSSPTKVPRDTCESRQPDAPQKTNITTSRKDIYPHSCTCHGKHLSPHVWIRYCYLQEGDYIYWSSFTQFFPYSILSFISALMSLPFLPFMYFAWHNSLFKRAARFLLGVKHNDESSLISPAVIVLNSTFRPRLPRPSSGWKWHYGAVLANLCTNARENARLERRQNVRTRLKRWQCD